MGHTDHIDWISSDRYAQIDLISTGMNKRKLSARAQQRKITELATVRYSKINDSFPLILRRIKHKKKRCEDCPKTVKDRRLEATCVLKPMRHWLIKCTKCDLFLDRHTGKYTMDWHQAHNRAITDSGYWSSDEYRNQVEMREARRRELARAASKRCSDRKKLLTNQLIHKDSDK
jgi:hypothetical protein